MLLEGLGCLCAAFCSRGLAERVERRLDYARHLFPGLVDQPRARSLELVRQALDCIIGLLPKLPDGVLL